MDVLHSEKNSPVIISQYFVLSFPTKKLITEKYWKHPAFVEALQLERCCERMEIEMSQMLLPLANLATEIMNEWKGRLRAVTVIDDGGQEEDEEEYKDLEDDDEDSDGVHDTVRVLLGWRDVPFMRELLRVSCSVSWFVSPLYFVIYLPKIGLPLN